MQKQTSAQFITERVRKLLVSTVFGILVLAPPMTFIAEKFFNGYTGSYIDQYYLFFIRNFVGSTFSDSATGKILFGINK